jgi:large subunit ribosomal protein L28
MSKKCIACNKQATSGNMVSHAKNRTKTKIRPNLQWVKIILKNGQVSREWVCTNCLKSGKVRKAMHFKKSK